MQPCHSAHLLAESITYRVKSLQNHKAFLAAHPVSDGHYLTAPWLFSNFRPSPFSRTKILLKIVAYIYLHWLLNGCVAHILVSLYTVFRFSLSLLTLFLFHKQNNYGSWLLEFLHSGAGIMLLFSKAELELYKYPEKYTIFNFMCAIVVKNRNFMMSWNLWNIAMNSFVSFKI